ncbi:hypothetical protein ACGFR8_31350 [Streptomyces brevispora]|uniref:hypothetical protein n=1 Tax=Streptomyces brevispora TaxID=887462 RepID=UPI00371806B4
MLNRPTAQAESQDLSRDLEVKVIRQPWNPALHPRDSKGRFIETGGTVRLWGGDLARVVRALPHDRILVQDQTGPNEFKGRRHTTSAKWVSMVARPDGSKPTDDEDKVAEEDEKRLKDERRGNGVVHDDDGDPSTPNDPHDEDDRGRPIGDDAGDGPDDEDDQDEPEDGSHPVHFDALPNRQHAAGARYADTAAVRRHFTQIAQQPGTSQDMATFLRSVAIDDDLRVTPSGRLAILRDDRTGRWYLTATGTGQRVDAAGDFETAQDAARFAEHLDKSAVNGQLTQFNQPFDFSHPSLDREARDWRSTKGENVQGAIIRARKEFDSTTAPAAAPKPPESSTPAPGGPGPGGQRFSTLQAVRAHWRDGRDRALQAGPDDARMQRAAQVLDELINNDRLKLVGRGQFVVGQDENGEWYLRATATGTQFSPRWPAMRDAQAFARSFVENPPKGGDGNPLDLSDPDTRLLTWRSDDNRSVTEVITDAAARWQRENTAAGTGEDVPEIAPGSAAPGIPDRAAPPVPQVTPDEPQAVVLPADAEPVDGVDGYHYVSHGGAFTLYGPDGQVAVTSGRGYPPKVTIDGVTIPVPQNPKQGAAVAARLLRAAQNPNERDRVTAAWVMKPGKDGRPPKRVMVFRGTVKRDEGDYSAIGSTRAIKWAPSLNGWSTQSNMTDTTRDERISEVLAKLARQGRSIHITDETGAGAPGAPDNAVDETETLRKKIADADDAQLTTMQQARWRTTASARSESARKRVGNELELIDAEIARRRQERDDNALRDASALSDSDIETRVQESQRERGTYGRRKGEDANDAERAIYAERRRRSQAVLDDDTDPTTLDNAALGRARKTAADRATLHQAAGDDHTAEQTVRQALQARHDRLVGEQQRRRAEQIADRPPVADLDDEALTDEYHDLIVRDFRKAPPEAQQVLQARMDDVKRERREREKRAITDRESPDGVDTEKLIKEYSELQATRSSYSETDDIKAARKDRMAAIEAELNRRDTTPDVEQLLVRIDNPDSNGQISIDGRSGYGFIDYIATTGHARPKLGWTWGKESWGHGPEVYHSRAAALAAMVRAYDTDDDRIGERTWGRAHRVFVPKMFFELYQSNRLGDRLSTASAERQYLYGLFASQYGWHDGVNPLIPSNKKGRHIKGRNLSVPEGLLAELNRVTEELARKVSVQATDRDSDSSDRSKAKTRLASINVALHTIEATREAVRKNGGDDDQKVISREEIEAQQAALRAALGGDDDEHVQPDGPGSLADAPAQGMGSDDRPRGVRDGESPGDREQDSGGRGGAGERGSGAGGVRGGSRPDQADQGGRDGDGSGGAPARAGARGGDGSGADGDGAAPAGDQGSDVRRVARFRPDPADVPKGARARATANVEAIRVLKALEAENRPATDDEKRILARWSGWGSVPVIFATEPNAKEPRYQQGGTRHGKFDRDHERWSEYDDIRRELQRVLTPIEFRQASRGVLSMHYTPQPIADAMWDGLRALGFDRGDVLEAGSGAGTFFGVAPDGARLTGVELDPTTARIAQAIYPHANILNESFAETDAHPGTFDAAIGNVPFARIPFDDKRYPAESLHNGFVTKEIALVRPGGITAVITSRQTLDSKGDKARRQMAKYGDLVGAVRLPSGVFNDAGTGVTTDVLVFRRREDGSEPADTSWLDAPERDINGTPHHVNAYFDEHPEHILGELTTQSGPFGPEVTVKGDAAKAAEQLRAALDDIATKAKADGRGYAPHPDGDDRPAVQLQTAREKHANDWTGRLYEGDDGAFYQHVNGAEPVRMEPADGNTAQLRDLMRLRDVAAGLRELDRKNDEEDRAEALRAELRNLHAAYVEKHGPLSRPGQHRTKNDRPTAWGYFRADPDAGAVLALERWDAKTGEPVLSRIFTERAAARRQPLTSTDDPKAALAAVVAANGEVDLGEVARLLDVTPQEALKRLGTEVFTDPATGRLELASAYLSGAVRDKLDAARKAAERDPAYAVNVASLEAVQPRDRTIGQFTPEMGAHWTPPELLQGFLREYLGDRTLNVAHDDRYGWILNTGRVPEANNVMYGVPAVKPDPGKGIKGNKGKNAAEIARAILGYGSLTVYEDEKRKEVDEVTSRLIRQKADQMRAEFAKYATANADRLTVLTDSYNRIMNGHIVRSYEGMSPTLEGYTPDRTPHPWQLSGAARMQFERGVILAHEVGLGKTGTLVIGTQALKASGQINKPMAVVPNGLAKQWADEARFLYPNADIHLITTADLAGDRRGSTLEWLRANRPDLVIFTEEAFGAIKMSPEAQDDYAFRELEALREQLDRQYEDATNPSHPFIVAKIEQRIATVSKNINKNAAPMRRPGETYWDDLGFDYFVVDEAHRYKGVGFRSKEGGGDPASIRGVDLHQKTTDLHRRRQGRATITLATGTPMSNSISEQFTMLSFASPWVLDAYRAGAPDLWANTFGRKTLRIENAPDGSGLRVVERFSEFHNKRAMKTMWGLTTDTKRAADVGIPRPKVKGGAPNLIMVDATPDQKKRLKGLVERGRAIHTGEVDRHEDNMLAVSNEGTSVALDPRIVDPNAPAGNKLKAVADRHIERYHATKDRTYKVAYGKNADHPVPGALQMIFLNEGVPGGKNKGNFDAYAELKRLMVAGGIPEDKIAFVQDAKKTGKPEDMTELFRRAREGDISVMIGSSAVAGVGMNAQDRMISLSHVDLDWGAAQMEQRNGRVLRYGNMNPEVEIDIFATKGSMDGWKAGFVAAKAAGLIDIQRPEPEDGDSSDVVQEIDGAEFDYETMEAEIGGNPYMSQLMKARRALKELEIDQHNEAAERIRRGEALQDLGQEAQDTREGLQRREQALPRIQAADDRFSMTLGGSPYGERSDAGKALHRQITARLLEHDREGMGPWHVLGQFRGLDFGVRTERDANGQLFAHVGFPDLRNSTFERTVNDLQKKGAGSGMITRLSNALDKAPALQESDRAKVPELDEQIALLQSAHAAADLTPQINHARTRANLLEEIVGRITNLDAKPEIDPDELDKKKYKQADRDKIATARREEREPLQAAVEEAEFALMQWDLDNPAPEQDDTVHLPEDEVRDTLARLRPEPNPTPGNDAPQTPDNERDSAATDSNVDVPAEEEALSPASGAGGNDDEPPVDTPTGGSDDESDEEGDADPFSTSEDTDASGDEPPADAPDTQQPAGESDSNETVTLTPDEVSDQLDALRPGGSKAPSTMDDAELRDEIVDLMGQDMAGDLSGADRTRLQVLEAEEARRAGRAPKPAPKPKRTTETPGGLFDVDDQTTPQADNAPDLDNPEDRPADELGTPDMFAAAEGRDTTALRPARMRNAADLEEGDRYTDADGHTHTVAEPPVRTGRGRTRIVTDDGRERFYNSDSELRLRYPDEEIPENEADQSQPDAADGPAASPSEADAETPIAVLADGPLPEALKTRFRALEEAAQAAGEDADELGGLGSIPETMREAEEALANGDRDVAADHLRGAASRAWPHINHDGDTSEFAQALRAFSVEAHNASIDLRPLREGEHLTTYRQLKQGDIIAAGDGYAVVKFDTNSRGTKHATWLHTETSVVGDELTFNPDNSDGGFGFTPADYNVVRADKDSEPVREFIAAEKKRIAERKAEEERIAAMRAARRAAEEQERQKQQEAEAEGNIVAPDRLTVGDRVRVTGLTNRGSDKTLSGHLLAEPLRVTRTVQGKPEPAWRLHVGPEGDEPTLANLLTISLTDRVDRLAHNEDDEQNGPSPTPDEDEDGEGDEESLPATDDDAAPDPDDAPADDEDDGSGPDGIPADEGESSRPGGELDDDEESEDDSAVPASEPDGGEGEPDPENENEDEDSEQRRRRRRRRRGNGRGGPGGGGPGGPGGPGLPRLPIPASDGSRGEGGPGEGRASNGRGNRPARHRDVESLRRAWRNGDGLTAAEDTPERRAALTQASERKGLQLSPGGGLVTWPEQQEDGTTLWRFAQARNGTNLPGIILTSDDPEEARALAGRFDEITDRNGAPFDWHEAWGPASVAAWRDGEGRNLPQALRAVQDDYEQERNGAFTLPDDLTGLDDAALEAAFRQGLGPADELRVMAEMDRRDGYVDERIRAAVPDTPPADADEAESRGRAMDQALGFGDTDVTQPAPATPGGLRREFDALDEERFQAAMQATGGRMLRHEAEAQGIDPRALFSGSKYSNKRAKELASPELNRWFDGDGETTGNGRLTYTQYRQREVDRALRAEFADIDEARYLAAIAATNGYFFRRQHEAGPIDERELFSGGSMSQFDRWKNVASEELQDWFDANGGRLTFNQFKRSRHENERTARDLHEEEQRRAAEAGGSEDTAEAGGSEDTAEAGGSEDTVTVTADDVAPAPSRDVESTEDATFRFGGHDKMREFADRADLRPIGDGETVWLHGRQIGHIRNIYRSNPNRSPVWDAEPFFGLDIDRSSRSQSRDTAIANLVVRALRDGPVDPTNPSEDVWRTVTGHLTNRAWELPESLLNVPEARARHDRLTTLLEAFRGHQSPSGDLRDDLVQARDDFAGLSDLLPDTRRTMGQRGRLNNRSFWAGKLLNGLGDPESDHQRPHGKDPDSDEQRPRGTDEPQGDSDALSPAVPTPDEPVNPPEDTARSQVEPESEPAPEPIGGQPAHWARVEDLAPGDMVRMDGTTKKGRKTQRAGYVYTSPVRVDVTRRGRTEQMWRTWITENPDGTGAAGNVYTSINATAARAESPDDVVPGSPVSGAQSALRAGGLPDVIPADRNGRGMFPGSTVGSNQREGTVTGATSTTVSVHWSDGRDDAAVSPSSLTVTGGERPDGWTTSGQRVRPQHIVSDTDGARLGPVDEVNGDEVTIATAEGNITRSAEGLRVTGEVRDDAPTTSPVAGIDTPAAADLKEGDIVVLDLDDTIATIAVTGTRRDGDRVTIEYADTTTGEVGEIEVDASAVLPRAQGRDGETPDLGPDDAPDADDDMTVHGPRNRVDPVTGPTVDPALTPDDRAVIDDHADGPDDDPDAQQAAARITGDLPVTPEQAAALAAQLRSTADPSTMEGRAALRAADHLDQAAGRTPPPGLDRPRPSNAAQLSEGDMVAMPDERRGDQVHVFRVIDAEDGPGGVRSLLLADENQQWRRRIVHGAMPVWQLPEAEPDAPTAPDSDDTSPAPSTPAAPSAPATPSLPVTRVRPGNLRVGDLIDAPTSRTGYQLNGHRRLTIISAPHRNGWWMQLTGIDDDGNVHDFGLHSGREVSVYERNRPTPALPPIGAPRDPNPGPQNDVDRIVNDHVRGLAARIIDEAIAGTEPPGDIHALRERIAQRLTRAALRNARRSARQDSIAALDAAGVTGPDRDAALQALQRARIDSHRATVRAALRTINDLEPLPDESDEDLAARARDLLSLIPDGIAGALRPEADGDDDIARTVAGHTADAVNALLRQLQAAGVDPGDADRIARGLTQQLAGTRQSTARRIARRVATVSPDAGRQPGLLARIVALLIRMAKRLVELVKAGAQEIGEKWRGARERMRRLRAFLGRLVRRVRQWPESRRLARLHRAVTLPTTDGESLASRVAHWAGLMPEPGRFGQAPRRVTWWRPTTWTQLAAGRLPERSDRVHWTPDRAVDGGPGLTALRHMAALRAAGSDVDQEVTRRLAGALGDDFGEDPHSTLQHADDYVATSERRLVNLQAARSSSTLPDDPELEVEITAARMEVNGARREYEALRARYAAAVPDAVAAALADIRDMGPEGNTSLVFAPDSDSDAEGSVRGVQRLIPRSWLNTPATRRVTAVNGPEGRYDANGQRITVADLADGGLGTAGNALAQHLAQHLGDLDAAQRVFWFTQTHTGRPGARRMRYTALGRLLSRTQTQTDTGDTLARSVQAMFSGDWYLDDDLRAFLLGLLATR